MKLDKLLELGLIRRIPKSKEKAEESIKTAKVWLKEAENNFKNRSCRFWNKPATSSEEKLPLIPD